MASFNYKGIEYSDLISREMSFSIARTIQNIPDRNCFAITEQNKQEFPAGVIDSISEADRNFEEQRDLPSSEIGPLVYSWSTVQGVDNHSALEILKKYHFYSKRPRGRISAKSKTTPTSLNAFSSIMKINIGLRFTLTPIILAMSGSSQSTLHQAKMASRQY